MNIIAARTNKSTLGLNLSEFELNIYLHIRFWVQFNMRKKTGRLKRDTRTYTFQTLNNVQKYLEKGGRKVSVPTICRALQRLEKKGYIESGFYAPKRYLVPGPKFDKIQKKTQRYKGPFSQDGRRLDRFQNRTKSYTVTGKYEKLQAQLQAKLAREKREKCISINIKKQANPLQNTTHLAENSYRGPSLSYVESRTERQSFFFKLGRRVSLPDKQKLWEEVCAHDVHLRSLGSEVRDKIAWARAKHFGKWEKNAETLKERKELAKKMDEEQLTRYEGYLCKARRIPVFANEPAVVKQANGLVGSLFGRFSQAG